MSDLAKLARKAKKEKVGKHEITIMPLGASDLDLFEKETKTKEETLAILKTVIMKSIPESTEEEYNNMSIEYMTELQEVIGRVNNVDEEKIKATTKVLKDIKEEQDAQSA